MDYKNLNGIWKLKEFYRINIYIFVLVSFVFSLNFSLNLIFRCIKSFVFKILFIRDYSSTFYLFDDKA